MSNISIKKLCHKIKETMSSSELVGKDVDVKNMRDYSTVNSRKWKRKFDGRHHDLVDRCVTNDHGCVPLVINTSQSCPRS
jgi:hypothetical protein